MSGYNGWQNRETWVINVWCTEELCEMAKEYVEQSRDELASGDQDLYSSAKELAEIFKDWFYECIMPESEKLHGVVQDLIYDSHICWFELAENHLEDAIHEAEIEGAH